MLAVVTVISTFPLYFMLVMASVPNDDITSGPRRCGRATSS